MADDSTLVIKRIKRSGADGHHGGAWKVAYADFVTAMMAFFLLMWLINTTTPEQKRGIADYFAAQNISKSSSGAGGILAGLQVNAEGGRADGAITAMNETTSPAPKTPARADDSGKGSVDEGKAPPSQVSADDYLHTQMPSNEERLFQQAELSLRQAMQDMPEIAELSRTIIMSTTPEGLDIQLVDQARQPMFEPGTATLLPKARRLLAEVARIVDRLPNRIAITGHTDGAPFQGPGGLTNWELSANRANAARAVLAAEGVESDRIFEISGKGGTDPLLPDDPNASANRRIGILLMREAPVVPPGHTL